MENTYLGLRNQEVRVDECASAQTSPNPEDVGLQVALILVDHVRSNDSDDGVPEPVGSGGKTDATRTNREREDLANDDPSTRAPGGGEEEDEDGDEGNLGVDSRDVVGNRLTSSVFVGVVEANGNTDNGNQELADQHAESTPDQERATTEPLDSPEGDRGGADVDEGEDQRDQEDVVNGAGRGQEWCGVVEDEVHTSPLLHHLKRGSEDSLAKVGVGLEDRATEAVHPAVDPAASRDERTLVLLIGNDLSKLSFDVLRVLRLTTDAGEGLARLLYPTTLDVVTRGVWQEQKTTTEDETEDELETDRHAVLSGALVVFDAVVDARGEQQTDSDAELVTGDQGTTNLLRANLRHVEDDNGGFETDTETSDETTWMLLAYCNLARTVVGLTSNNQTETVGCNLEDNSDNVDKAAGDNSPFTCNNMSVLCANVGFAIGEGNTHVQ